MATKTIFSITRTLPFPRTVQVPDGASHRLIDATYQAHQLGGYMSDSDPDFLPYRLAAITRLKTDYGDDVYRLHYHFDGDRAESFLQQQGDRAPAGLADSYHEREGSMFTINALAATVLEVIEYSDSQDDANAEAERMAAGELAEGYQDDQEPEPDTETRTTHPLSIAQYELVIGALKDAPTRPGLDEAILLLEMAMSEARDEDENDDDDKQSDMEKA